MHHMASKGLGCAYMLWVEVNASHGFAYVHSALVRPQILIHDTAGAQIQSASGAALAMAASHTQRAQSSCVGTK